MATFTFAQLVAMVIVETNRPDLVAETQQAVFEATLTCHAADFWLQDIVQMQTTFTTADYIQTLDTSTIPNFRNMAFFRKTVPGPTLFQPMDGSVGNPLLPDPVSGSYSIPMDEYVFLTPLGADDIIDDWGYEKTDIIYQAGSTLYIKSSTSIVNGQFGYYAFPNLDIPNTGAGYTSWIANKFPYLIVYKAAATVFKKIGQDAATAAYNNPNTGLAAEQLRLLQMSQITMQGR